MARRKNKQTRKFKAKNEFRYCNSEFAQHHPHYIFGETKSGDYKSFGLTTTPSSKYKYLKLTGNPNPNDNRTSYLQKRVTTANPNYYSKDTLDWKFSNTDMSIVRHRIKDYKKSYNRQPKNWYIKKKQHKKR